MKTKVQAQRKFAQGVFIPPSLHVPSGGIERRNDISPMQEKSIYNNISARSLMDIVAFKNVHKHAQPVVLLRRLDNIQYLCSRDQVNSIESNEDLKSPIPDKTNCGVESQENTTNDKIIAPQPPMQLRSRVLKYSERKTISAYKKKKIIGLRNKVISIIQTPRKLRKKRHAQKFSDYFSVDDDRPLTYFQKKALIMNKNNKCPKSVLNSEPESRNKIKPITKGRAIELRDSDAELDTSEPVPGSSLSDEGEATLVPIVRRTFSIIDDNEDVDTTRGSPTNNEELHTTEPAPESHISDENDPVRSNGGPSLVKRRGPSSSSDSQTAGPSSDDKPYALRLTRRSTVAAPIPDNDNEDVDTTRGSPTNNEELDTSEPAPESHISDENDPVRSNGGPSLVKRRGPSSSSDSQTAGPSSDDKPYALRLRRRSTVAAPIPDNDNEDVDTTRGSPTNNEDADTELDTSKSHISDENDPVSSNGGPSLVERRGPSSSSDSQTAGPSSDDKPYALRLRRRSTVAAPIPDSSDEDSDTSQAILKLYATDENKNTKPTPRPSTNKTASSLPSKNSRATPSPSAGNKPKTVTRRSLSRVTAAVAEIPGQSSSSDNQTAEPSSDDRPYALRLRRRSTVAAAIPESSDEDSDTSQATLKLYATDENKNTKPTPRSSTNKRASSLPSKNSRATPSPSAGNKPKTVTRRSLSRVTAAVAENDIDRQKTSTSSTQSESAVLKNPPFYGMKKIQRWLSSNITFDIIPSPQAPKKKKRNSSFNSQNDCNNASCIASRLLSFSDITSYGASYFDNLCLKCKDCKNIHEILNTYKKAATCINSNIDVRIRKRRHQESNGKSVTSTQMVIEVEEAEEKKPSVIDLTEDENVSRSGNVNTTSDNNTQQTNQDQSQQQTQEQNQVQTQENISQGQTPQNEGQDHRNETGQQSEEGRAQDETQGVALRQVRNRRKRALVRMNKKVSVNKGTRRRIDAFSPVPSILTESLRSKIVSAPEFYPTIEQLTDPIAYLEKIMPMTENYGIFKIIVPDDFKPPCDLSEQFKFSTTHQYIARLFKRWGSATRELCAIRAQLVTQDMHFKRGPLLDGLEVDLPRVFHIVQRLGGLKAVMDKQKWHQIAAGMNIKELKNPQKKFSDMILKYLLPYNSLTKKERESMMMKVEQRWLKKNSKLMKRVANPLQRQKRLLGEVSVSDEETEEDDSVSEAINIIEDCSQLGRKMGLDSFKKISKTAFQMFVKYGDKRPTVEEIENKYWNVVLLGNEHVSVNSAFIESGLEGLGSPANKTDTTPNQNIWSLRSLSRNKRNTLRLLGSLAGMTVPSLHVGMVFSTSCLHRDPHGLPWMDYLHKGAEKIWYGVPSDQGNNLRRALEVLCPTLCQNKTLWLPSEIAMAPLNLLLERNVKLTRCIQRPGEFIVVNPQAYSSSVSTDFTVSESVYFATQSYFENVNQAFQEMRESCEPSSFSLEQLLIAAAKDSQLPQHVLRHVYTHLNSIVVEELFFRRTLIDMRVSLKYNKRSGVWSARDDDECHVCRCALYLSRVKGLFKNAAVCLQHAVRIINVRRNSEEKVGSLDMEIAMSDDELEEILLRLKETVGIKEE